MPLSLVTSQVRQEVHNFFQGVVESFGVVLVWSYALDKRRARDGAEVTDEQGRFSPPPFSSTPLADVAEGAAAEGALATTPMPGSAAPLPRTAALSGSGSDAPRLARTFLMPSWSLLERDPKLWMLLRKNLLANLALACLTLMYMGLSRCLASNTPSFLSRAAAGGRSATTASLSADARSSNGTTATRSLTTSLVFLLLLWSVRLGLWMLKYVGQWPFYTLLQIIGLVWFSQLYRETWLVRKGWVLRGTELREAPAAGSAKNKAMAGGGGGGSDAGAASHHAPPTSPPPSVAAGAALPWLSLIPLYSGAESSGDGEDGTSYEARGFSSSLLLMCTALLRSVPPYVRHTTNLVWRMITHKGPTAVLQDWVLGDASKAAAAAAAASALTSARHHHAYASGAASPHQSQTMSTSPDPFATVVLQLEAISEVLFKALATMSFALFASAIERLPLIGTPLCAVLNAQLYVFYVFDYRYAAQQQPDAVHHRGSALTYQLRHFEQCSMYYAGYGMSSAVLSLWLTHQLGTVVSVCAVSVLYSWQVVWSGFAVPLPSSRPVPLFSVWFYAVDMAQRHYAVLWRVVVIAILLYLPLDCACWLLGTGV
ncbi:Etoposide-induced protein 2.4 (EI24), putative [Leishmania donovani]|uniref:Etoposide-induced protein 2.4 (EI24), putative n=1 Tax=Leishmania donovani TaxID=5661 RepID=A0A3S7X2B9_LEIDO|nr:Etoposide-induced protein 2.4 (EI24), putative [Leishmania donovani]